MDVLSPPKATGTERLLNHATVPVIQVESIESKLSRNSSAPAGQESLKEAGVERGLKAATVTGIGGANDSGGAESLGRREMTNFLKKLAEGGDTALNKPKAVGDLSA
jgi:hypothetical protein